MVTSSMLVTLPAIRRSCSSTRQRTGHWSCSRTRNGASISADIVGEHVRARLDGTPPIALAEIMLPAQGGVASWLRRVGATWVAVAAAALFVFGVAFGL